MTAHADITRVTLTCPGFEGREATIVGPYRAPGAWPGEFVVLLAGDFPGKTMAVQPRDVRGPVDLVTCGTCERSWNDAVSTSLTPAPSGRCPFEYDHEEEEATRSRVVSADRVGNLAAWIERDRREPDKVLAYAQELARLVARAEAS